MYIVVLVQTTTNAFVETLFPHLPFVDYFPGICDFFIEINSRITPSVTFL